MMDKQLYKQTFENFYSNSDPWGVQSSGYTDFHNHLIELLNYRKYNRILDVGCGEGPFTNKLAVLGKTIGVDVSETAIKRAKTWYGKNAQFIACDIRDYQMEPFDLICCLDVLYYLEPSDLTMILNKFSENMTEKGVFLSSHAIKNGETLTHTRYAGSCQQVEDLLSPFFKILKTESVNRVSKLVVLAEKR